VKNKFNAPKSVSKHRNTASSGQFGKLTLFLLRTLTINNFKILND
jgi:hypothetical protein